MSAVLASETLAYAGLRHAEFMDQRQSGAGMRQKKQESSNLAVRLFLMVLLGARRYRVVRPQ